MKYMALMIAAVIVGVGCGKPDTTVVGPDGQTATVSHDGQTTTVTDAKGNKASVSTDGKQTTFTDDKGNSASMGATVTEGDLGLPFYTGSTEIPNASMTITQNGEKVVTSSRTTKDDPATVAAFYKGKVEGGKQSDVNAGDIKSSTVSGKLKDGADVAISATKSGAEDTKIQVMVSHKK